MDTAKPTQAGPYRVNYYDDRPRVHYFDEPADAARAWANVILSGLPATMYNGDTVLERFDVAGERARTYAFLMLDALP